MSGWAWLHANIGSGFILLTILSTPFRLVPTVLHLGGRRGEEEGGRRRNGTLSSTKKAAVGTTEAMMRMTKGHKVAQIAR